MIFIEKMVYGLFVVLIVTGCSMTLPVTGSIQGTKESFSGSATGYADGSGVLTVFIENGVTCKGDFVYVTRREGEGVFTCNDGRMGPFEFVSTGTRGTGTGKLDGEPFIFTFGK
ncbi:MAG: hypothetical protein KME67_05135 [Candidatus Thiodiazotropha sp. (ex Codakia orbicularis)]|nr:hypothetical protein [Candidatus Thiodiazotropha sp. (ex Codakia orbicularis)]